jgi:hypothetical protein
VKTYSAAITVEFRAHNDEDARVKQNEIASEVVNLWGVVYADTIGPPECFEGCNESETE